MTIPAQLSVETLLSDVAVISLSSIVLLTPNGQFLDSSTVAYSERYGAEVKNE